MMDDGKNVAVKFLRDCQQGTLYNEGEVAGFDVATAERLCEQGFAEPFKAPKAAAGGDK